MEKRKWAEDLIELSRYTVTNDFFSVVWVLATEPESVNGHRDFYEFGTEHDVYCGFWGCPVEHCGSLDEVKEQLKRMIDFDKEHDELAHMLAMENHFLEVLDRVG